MYTSLQMIIFILKLTFVGGGGGGALVTWGFKNFIPKLHLIAGLFWERFRVSGLF